MLLYLVLRKDKCGVGFCVDVALRASLSLLNIRSHLRVNPGMFFFFLGLNTAPPCRALSEGGLYSTWHVGGTPCDTVAPRSVFSVGGLPTRIPGTV